MASINDSGSELIWVQLKTERVANLKWVSTYNRGCIYVRCTAAGEPQKITIFFSNADGHKTDERSRSFHPGSDSAPRPPPDNLSRNTRTTTLSDQEHNSDSPCLWRFLGSALMAERARFLLSVDSFLASQIEPFF